MADRNDGRLHGAFVHPMGGRVRIIGSAKPVTLEWRHLAGSEIIGVKLVENVAIYLWLDRNGEPAAYKLPWSVGDAQSLQDGIKRMGEQGGGKMVFGRVIDGVPQAPMDGDISTVIPPAKLPDKSQ
jgi:hypothetical protein